MKKEEQSFCCGTSVSQKGHALSGWILRFVPLFAMLFATLAAKAASDGDGVKFNKDVRYSQWAINSRAHDFYANSTAFGLAKYKADGTKIDRKDSKNKLDYVPGLVAKSMIEAADYYQNFDWSKPWFASVKEYGDAYYGKVSDGGGSLDDLNAVKLYIGVYNNKNASETDRAHAKTAIGLATDGLKVHNTKFSIQTGTLAGNEVVGGWFHKEAYNNQMWLDGAYMGSALLAQIVNFNGTGSNVFGSADNDWNMVFKQLDIVWNMCWNRTDKLMYHAFEANAGTGTSKSHADTWQGLNGTTKPYTFHSAAYWGRANAWYIFALVDALEAMGKAGRTADANYTTLKSHLQELAAGIVARQASNGGWYQLLDKDNTFTPTSYNSNWSGKPKSATNYIETSATAIFSAALFKAVRLGLIDTKYKENAKKAFECLVNNYTYLKDGSLEIWGSCRSAGLGGGTGNDYAKGGKKYRDGSNQYYLLGYDVPMVEKKEGITEGKVLGGFIMAATEYERAYQNQDNASILFSYDLKPAYDLTQSGATAPVVEVCGTDAAKATYQWYDATTGNAVDGAGTKEAQFTPQTTGDYYCVATVGSTSIKTSATNIKVNSNSSADKQKFTVTATAVNGTVEIKDGAGNVVTSGTQVEEGTKLVFTANANTGYVFDSWTATGGEASDNVYTISSIAADVNVKANFKKENTGGGDTGGETTTETVFSMVTTAESDVSVASGDTKTLDGNADKTGGSAELYNGKSSATVMISKTEGVKLNGSRNSYMKVTLNKPLAKGDVIAAPDCGSSFYVTSADTKTTDAPEVNATGYTIPENSDLIGKTVIYFWSGKGKSITITRKTTTQTTSPLVIAVENVEMNVTDEETLQPEVRVYGIGDKLLTLGTDYKLSFSTDNDNVTINDKGVFTAAGSQFNYTEGVTHVTVTATPSEKLAGQYTKATEDFTFTVRKGKMKPEFMSAFNATTIKVAKGTKKTIEVPLNYGGEDVSGYFDVKYSCSPSLKLTNSDNKMTCNFGNEGTYQITVSATPKIINKGTDTEFDYSQEYDAPEAVTFTVDVNSYTVPKVTLDPSTDKTIYVGQVVDAPAVSVTDAQDTAIDKSKYTMEWTSFAPDVCKVDATTGKIEGVSAGDKVKIQLKVSGNGFEDVFAYLLVSVDDPAKYRVKAPGSGMTYSPMTPFFNQNKTLAVTLGGWSFTNRSEAPVSKEGLTYGDNNKWAKDSSKATWVIKGFDYYLPGLTCQNARQEDGACPLPSETQWYDGKLQKVKGGTVDPMFYVPCSGAYLTVEPKTNGKVSVSVFQNGVFDKSGGVYAYRPQRRVFVLDEAGKVVASEATISATGGKLSVADKNATGDLKDPYKITNYPCNITGLASGPSTTGGGKKNSNPSPTIEDVKNHFRGMTSFEMTATGFQNNVYESNIDNKVTWGSYATPNNGADDNVKGSHGWSVLVDAAVTYTFDVKAGKTYYIYNYGSKLGFYGFSFDEAKGQTVKNYEFDEAAANTIELTKAGELTTAKVNRAMAAGVWTTCVLPFSLNKQQVDAIFGKTYDRDTPNGTQILYFDRVEGTKAIFVRHAYNNIVAGKPFLIKPTKDVASINTAEVKGYPYVTIENTQPAEWCKGNGYVWMSSYSNGLTVKKGDCFISNKDGSFKNFVGDPGTLKGFRGYLKNIGTNGVSEAKKLTVGMGSNVTTDETSAIDGILIDCDMPADSVTAADRKVYNLNGQVVATSYRQFQALPGGVYVVSGKKVVK